MQWKRRAVQAALAVAAAWLLLSLPPSPPPALPGAGAQPFAWNREPLWKSLEGRFREARAAGCPGTEAEAGARLREGERQLDLLAAGPRPPADHLFDEIEANLFALGPLAAACPARTDRYAALVAGVRAAVKLQSRAWDVRERDVHDRLYRLLYGGRTALEEVLLQAPPGSRPAILRGTDEPSAAPAHTIAGVELRSGDILVSRGGAPTSALIARGSDHPGNFSHVALLHVDAATGVPSVVESHIERGVVVSTPGEYLGDKKLRIMVLRLRSDHPLLARDPLLPHRAASAALAEARARHVPYDFAMDGRDPARQFCSEVASHAYAQQGLALWKAASTMSSPGLVRWLADLGVRNFETQAPADLEYDPDLVVVAEWRDPEALWADRVDNAVTDALLAEADRGLHLRAPWYLLAPARAAKGASALLNLFGKVGPVPEGMDAAAALRSRDLDRLHAAGRERVLAGAAAFERERGYRPPYWELVRLAEAARRQGPVSSPR